MWRLWAVPEKDRGMESHGKHADSTTLRFSAACGHGPVPGAGCGSASFAVTVAGRESLATLRSSGPDNRASPVPTQITKPSTLHSHKAEIFRFARRPKVPLTNNRSEGDIRTARAKFHEGRGSATWSTCRESAVAFTAILMSNFRLPLRRPWPSTHSFAGFLTVANPLQLRRSTSGRIGEHRRRIAGDVTKIASGRFDGWPVGSVGQ